MADTHVTDTQTVRALTIRQPWAHAIAYGDKRVENRTWPTRWRGLLLIHAGVTVNRADLDDPRVARVLAAHAAPLRRGAVIATAHLVDCHPDDGACSDWSAYGQWHWVLDQVVPVQPVSCSGALGLWVPGPDVLDAVGVGEEAGHG